MSSLFKILGLMFLGLLLGYCFISLYLSFLAFVLLSIFGPK